MYGLLGEKLGHSYSKLIHEKLGYDYELIEKRPDELAAFLSARRFSGLNVTIPYKKEVMKYCDRVSDLAARIGAVNTLYFCGDFCDGSDSSDAADLVLTGTNTDYIGLSYAMKRAGISMSGRKVLILGGTGGAGSMARVLAADEGAREIVIATRSNGRSTSSSTGRNAEADPRGSLPDRPSGSLLDRPSGSLSDSLPDRPAGSRETGSQETVSYASYSNLPSDAEIIINATPVGTYPNITDSPVDLSGFTKCVGVADLIYNPLRTDLLMQARELGIKYTNGLAMLVRQATAAAEFFHCDSQADNSEPACRDGADSFGSVTAVESSGKYGSQTEKILRDLERSIENIVLIGMPGCGKSSIGRILSRRTGRTMKDTDEMVKGISGRTPAQIIKEDGEAAFRKIETEAVRLLAKEHSLIISTGGGVVTREVNVRLLKQNGRIFFLDRDPDKLSTYNRPLSQNGGVYRIYDERYPIYSACCDVRIENNGKDFAPAADAIISK